MDDEILYLKAMQEVEGSNRNEALWAKAITLADGDLEKAKYRYINLRVKQLANNASLPEEDITSQNSQSSDGTAAMDASKKGFVSAKGYAKSKGIKVSDVIAMIVANELDGKYVNREWFVPEKDKPDWVRGEEKESTEEVKTIDGDSPPEMRQFKWPDNRKTSIAGWNEEASWWRYPIGVAALFAGLFLPFFMLNVDLDGKQGSLYGVAVIIFLIPVSALLKAAGEKHPHIKELAVNSCTGVSMLLFFTGALSSLLSVVAVLIIR